MVAFPIAPSLHCSGSRTASLAIQSSPCLRVPAAGPQSVSVERVARRESDGPLWRFVDQNDHMPLWQLGSWVTNAKDADKAIKPTYAHQFPLLKEIDNSSALMEGTAVHSYTSKHECTSNISSYNTMVNKYFKCGSLQDAHLVLDRFSKQKIVTWGALVAGTAQNAYGLEASYLSQQMLEGSKPDRATIVCILKGCSSMAEGSEHGKWIHAHIIESGLESDLFVGSALVDMYVKGGKLEHARMLFDRMPKRNAVICTSLISGYTQHGHDQEAFDIFEQMHDDGMKPNQVMYVCILKACAGTFDLTQGKQIHAEIVDSGFESNIYVGSTLIDMYSRCESLQAARVVFERLPRRNTATWNALIAGYARHGDGQEALDLYKHMQQNRTIPNKITFVCILKACSGLGALEHGKKMHANTIECGFELDLCIGSILVHMYADSGNLRQAHTLFDRLPKQNVVTWSSLIAGYAEHGHGEKALQLFQQMQQVGMKPNHVTCACIVKACSSLECLEQGRQTHACIIEIGLDLDLFVGNNLTEMYGKCGSMQDAFVVFNKLPIRNVVTWTVLIDGYAQYGSAQEAFQLFQQMQKEGIVPNQVTFVSLVKMCSSIASLDHGKRVHAYIIESGLGFDLFVGNTLIDMYAKCGSLLNSCLVFDRLPERDLITWSALLAGYSQRGDGLEALNVFQQMQEVGIEPDRATFLCILKACSSMAALWQGKQIHATLIQCGLDLNVSVGSALINMYAKCGSLQDAHMAFERLPRQDVVTWSALIAGYAYYSDIALAFHHFKGMQQAGFKPDSVTFLSLLSACGHVGAVDEGCLLFKAMREDLGLTLALEHYNSLVDLLGHARWLNEAEDLLESIPFRDNMVGWISLLSSCRVHGSVDLGKRCFNQVVRMEHGHAASYVLMSSIYALASMPEDAERIEQARRYANAWKKPGKAFIEIDNKIHSFTVGDKTHPRTDDIYGKLNTLSAEFREQGYVPNLSLVLDSDKDKEDALCGHCEKLAIALGLLNTPRGTTIRVAKNMRVCSDCHTVTKLISKIEMRQIIVSDVYRIHQFKDGECSCKDYY